jgi:sulfite reductase (NADPH) flavoprotein alpha-component
VDCDVDYQADADAWIQQVLVRIKETEQEKLARQGSVSSPGAGPAPGVPTRARPATTSLLANVMLNEHGANKDTRLIALSTEGTGLEYEVGDALGVWALNCPDLVDELLVLCGLDGQLAVNVPTIGEIALREALLRHFEIARPSGEMLSWIAQHAADKHLQTMLDDSDKATLKDWLWGKQLADIVRLYPVSPTAEKLVSLLKRMQPRLYSIASSPAAHPGEIHLTVGTVRYGSAQMPRKGVSSTYLADRCIQSPVPVFVQKSTHFRPPSDGHVPMIMIGPGTGIAPFRAFLHERKARGDKGDNWLFFGEQREATDFYYRDELETMRAAGHLTRLSTAFSRDQSEKIYVQHRMRQEGADVWAWLQRGAYLYVCGDASKMAKDVDAALKSIVALHGNMNEQAATEYVNGLAKARRYLRDVY